MSQLWRWNVECGLTVVPIDRYTLSVILVVLTQAKKFGDVVIDDEIVELEFCDYEYLAH